MRCIPLNLWIIKVLRVYQLNRKFFVKGVWLSRIITFSR